MFGEMKYFGGFNNNFELVSTPVGKVCLWCEEKIKDGDKGFLISNISNTEEYNPAHTECFLRQIYGSIGHQKKNCSCFGGSEEDPVGLSKRESAIVAVDYFKNNS